MIKICNKQIYIKTLEVESRYYKNGYKSFTEKAKLLFTRDMDCYYMWNYMKALRKSEYYRNCQKEHKFTGRFLYYFCERRKNALGSKLGISIADNCLGLNAVIYHPNVIINPKAVIGEGCKFHGNNCIGNKGADSSGAPRIGDGVELGFGAVVIGDIEIADGIIIGANSVVTKSFYEKGAVIAGNPARIIK